MKKVVIIGAGASGLITAIHTKNDNNEVIILEKNNNCGKKILVTGNGKCNYFNSDQSIDHYHSNEHERLNNFINENNCNKVLNFFESIGITPEIKDGYYYPKSNQAISIKNALVKEAENRGIKIINNTNVITVEKIENKFFVKSDNDTYEADIVVLATGSKAAPKTGSNGIGYKIAKDFNLEIIKPLPGLVQLVTKENLKDISGVRSKVNLSLYENDNLIKEEVGELQITDYGISGICAMQLSSFISKGLDAMKNEVVRVNFVPWIDIDLKTWLDTRNKTVKNRTISELLDGILNYKLVNYLLKKANIKSDDIWDTIPLINKEKLINNLSRYDLEIIKTKDFDSAQICVGGVSLNEIDDSFMAKKVNNLYIVGELLDVNGDCGGYNLTFAWISGILAGEKISRG